MRVEAASFASATFLSCGFCVGSLSLVLAPLYQLPHFQARSTFPQRPPLELCRYEQPLL